ncbi:unnamed protein product [Orchesella dallaii]|uniref:Uncharacterized protein n=1 Tax=Orchesella dallaii TaxID=48710 RepID=A0ABP1QMX1_9HEXA
MKAVYSFFVIVLVIMTCNKTQPTVQASPVDTGSVSAAADDKPVAHILPVIPESPQQTPQILPVSGQSSNNPAVLVASTTNDDSSVSSSAAASGH